MGGDAGRRLQTDKMTCDYWSDGTYECQQCLGFTQSVARTFGMKIQFCTGSKSGCSMYVSVIGVREQQPRWANQMGVTLTITGTIKLCFVPVSFEGSIDLQVAKGSCRNQWIAQMTYAMYGSLRLTIHAGVDSTYLRGDAFIANNGGFYVAGPFVHGYDRRRRRASKCSCELAENDGSIKSCPKWASTSGEIAFSMKISPLKPGDEYIGMAGFISFKFSLNLFGVNLAVPLVPDMPLFDVHVGKIVGDVPAPTPKPLPQYNPWLNGDGES